MEKDNINYIQEAVEESKPLPPTPPPLLSDATKGSNGGGEWQPMEDDQFQQFGEQPSNGHGECCEECKRTCKRNFWTQILNTVVKISTIVLAALGLSSVNPTPTLPGEGEL